ncbi:MAG TPA: hypothetical protein VF062_28740, partial [Candidatus Limnocylindrales bacterium]
MIRYILRATASRKAEALVVATLAALLAAVVAAAPWYAADRGVQAATAGLRQTAAGKAVVSGERILAAGEKPDTARRDAERELAAVNLPRSRIVSAVQADGQSTTESRPAGVARLNSQLVARSDVCAEVAVRGRCPQTSGEAMIPAELAAELSVDVGGTILFSESNPNRAARLTVTGIYRILDPQARYWAGRFPDRARRERLILVAQTDLFEAAGARTPQLVVDLVPGDDMFAHVTPAEAIERLDSAPLALSKLEYTTPLRDFAVTLRDRQDALWQGMLVVAGEIVIFSWLVLFLVLRQMSWQHRTDLGTLKLRGIGSWRTISLTVGRHFSGLAAGAVAGTLAAWAFGFEPMSLVLVATVFAGSCLAGLIAERWSLRADVLHLLRSVPRGHGGIVLSGL